MTLTRLIRSFMAPLFCLFVSASAFNIPTTSALVTHSISPSACSNGSPLSPAQITPSKAGKMTEYQVPSGGVWDVTAGPDGNVWFTEKYSQNIGSITPSGQETIYSLGNGYIYPYAITSGPDGNLWFTGALSLIGRITPQGQITEFKIPGSNPGLAITAGPDGNLWFTQASDIGRITPQGIVTEFPLPDSDYRYGITTGLDGNLWFTNLNDNTIGRITPQGQITEIPIPTPDSQPVGITTGPGGSLWFTQENGEIGRMTPRGKFREFPLTQSSEAPLFIATGPDGNLWFTESVFCGGDGDSIVRITPQGVTKMFPIPYNYPVGITAGPHHDIWFAGFGDFEGEIGKITTR